MQDNQTWIDMFRRIPGNLQDMLALGLTTGAEIVVQKIVKLEPDFMIIRGRLAGTQDSGRIVLIPYGELTFVAISKFLKDTEVETIFGKGAPTSSADMPEFGEPEAPLEEHPVEDATISKPTPASAPRKAEQQSKTVLLAKLRNRLKDTGK